MKDMVLIKNQMLKVQENLSPRADLQELIITIRAAPTKPDQKNK